MKRHRHAITALLASVAVLCAGTGTAFACGGDDMPSPQLNPSHVGRHGHLHRHVHRVRALV